MCTWVQAIVQAVGSDVSAAGTVYNQLNQAGAAATNAIRARSAAADAYRQGESQAATHALKAGRMSAAQTAAAGASGFSVSSESTRDVMAGSAQNFTLDVAMLRRNASREAGNYLSQSRDYSQAADAYRTSAVFSVIGGALMAGGQAAQAYGESNGWKKKSVTDYSGWGDERPLIGKGGR